MNKKDGKKGGISLTLSLIMFCVSLLVLSFGVMAVRNIQYNLNGNFSYTVNQVFATIETKVYASQVTVDGKSTLSKYAGELKADTVPTTIGTNNDALTNLTEYDSLSNTLEDSSNSFTTTKKISVDFNKYNTYFARIKVTNLADNSIWVAIINQTIENPTNIISVKTSNVQSIEKNKSGIIVVAYSIEDLTLDIPKTTFSNNVSVSSIGSDFPVAKEYSDFVFGSASDGVDNMTVKSFTGAGDTAIIPETIAFEEKAPGTVVINTQEEYDTYFKAVAGDAELVSNINKGVWIRYSNTSLKAKLNGETEFTSYENFSEFNKRVNSNAFPLECDFREFSMTDEQSRQELTQYRLYYYLYFANGIDYKLSTGVIGHVSVENEDTFSSIMEDSSNFPIMFYEPNEQVAVEGNDYVVSEIGVTGDSGMSFMNRKNLKYIYLPKTIKKISQATFAYDDFEAVYIDDIDAWSQIIFENSYSNPMIAANYIYIKNSSGQYEPLKDLTFSSNVTDISSYAFISTKGYVCESITIPNTITKLNDSSITFGAYTLDIRSNVQYGSGIDIYNTVNLRNLSGVDLKTLGINELSYREVITTEQEFTNPVTKEGDYYTYSYGGEKYLLGVDIASKKTELNDIPQDVTIIGSSAFAYRDTIKSIVVPKNIKKIDIGAFMVCVNLHNVSFEANSQLTEICEATFEYCSSLNEIEIPEGVTTIGENAFLGDVHLFKITLPSTLTTIGTSNTFLWCYGLVMIRNLSSIDLSEIGVNNNGSLKLGGNPDSEIVTNAEDEFVNSLSKTEDGKYWTYNCPSSNKKYIMGATNNGTKVIDDLPSDVNAIYQYAFYQQIVLILTGRLNPLERVVIPNNIQEIGESSLGGNPYLSTFIIESQSVYDSVTDKSSIGGGLEYITKIYVSKTIVEAKTNTYMENSSNYTKADGTGKYADYYCFTKVSW